MSGSLSASIATVLEDDLSSSDVVSQTDQTRSRGCHSYVAPERPAPTKNACNATGTDDDSRKACVSTNISNLRLSGIPMAGFEVIPIMTPGGCSLPAYQWEWFVEISDDQRWMKVSEGLTFIPESEHVGRKIKVKCVPCAGQEDGPREVISEYAIAEGPKYGGMSQRHHTTADFLQSRDQLRIITYNILFDAYLRRDSPADYRYCATHVLEESFRQQLVLKEVKRYHGDILCFQEVGPNVYTTYLQPALNAAGYEGVFTSKPNEFREGLAMFYRTDKIQLKQSSIIIMKDVLISDNAFSSLRVILQRHFADVFQLVCSLDHVCQVVIFSNGARSFMVLNTHLYWTVDFEFVPLIQVYIIFHCIDLMRKELGLEGAGIVFAGDLNNQPNSDTYRYINEGKFQLGKGTKDQIHLHHSLRLTNATGTPRYSCVLDHTQFLLDYVYVNSYFSVLQCIPLPTEEELEQDGKFVLPSSRFGSDHLAIGVDVEMV
ncbi:2',5'-phosphodiesterase 12-like [Corticium candelabrum]|uniref:2',5'-phosphodiesterase 12-like n=1 Tax=Corticium candelabrum TaxID=121492 RepID=UPI002E262470|nr:2',5'-phosphodiesterase 12-like [Corticium candelabrum]